MNNNYSIILKAGFDIEVRSQQFSMARMYLTCNGTRTGQSVLFNSGHFCASKVMEKAKFTRKDTHLDKALKELAYHPSVIARLVKIKESESLQTGWITIGSLSHERLLQNISAGTLKI